MPDTTAVSIKNVSKQFDNIEVLRDINLTVEKGSVVSILGSSGSGKSTLLRCMNWLEQPDRGRFISAASGWGLMNRMAKPCPIASCRKSASGWGWCSRALTCGRT
jgi:ABC-type polar amino acid transport system ATPase subunit